MTTITITMGWREVREIFKSNSLFTDMFLMRDEKEERKKQARSNKQTKQSNTAQPRQSLFLRKTNCLGGTRTHDTLYSRHVQVYKVHTASSLCSVTTVYGSVPRVGEKGGVLSGGLSL